MKIRRTWQTSEPVELFMEPYRNIKPGGGRALLRFIRWGLRLDLEGPER